MASGPKIVHKQFNSPIGLYSQNNIQETLNKHLQNLDNGTVGIDFNNPATGKPGNLANSAVLRMLEEEEERNRKGYPSKKKVVWPPAPETNGYHSSPQQLSPAYAQQPSQQYEAPQQQYQSYPQSQSAPQPQYSPQFYQVPQSKPAFCEAKRQEPTGLSRLIPVGPGVTPAPVSPPYRAAPSPAPPAPLSPQPYNKQNNRWAPVAAPLSPQAYGSQPSYPSAQQQQQYSAPYEYPQKPVEPPATIITLRQSQPVHQRPPPVFASQPAAASFQGGVNMRGDMKWPPQTVKEAVEAENEARRQLAKGPACRPRKMKKDYSSFFAKHALNQNYPGYRAPPGTQHYEDHSGRSSY